MTEKGFLTFAITGEKKKKEKKNTLIYFILLIKQK